MITYISSSDLFLSAIKTNNGEKMNFTDKYKVQKQFYNLQHANRHKCYYTMVLALCKKKYNFATICVRNTLEPGTKY